MRLHPTSTAPFCALLLLSGTQLNAQDSYYQHDSKHGLKFADLEFAMPTDPLLPSAIGISHVIHTPEQYMLAAANALRSAVPAGTNASAATTVLNKAGAHCRQPNGETLICRYRDVETPWGGEYFDSISWTVTLPLVDGHVTDLVVTRDWTRR